MSSPSPFHVVIAGGGVAALEGALALRDIAGDRVALTLVTPSDHFHFRPLDVAVPFAAGHGASLALSTFAADAAARLVPAPVRSVHPRAHEVEIATGERLSYDALLLAVGARGRPHLPGALHFTGAREVDRFAGLLRDLEEGYTRRVAFVVPPRNRWPLPLYELALMTARQVRGMGVDDAEIALVTAEAAPLSLFGVPASAAVAAELERAGVALHAGAWAEPDRGRRGVLILRPSSERIEAQRVVTLPRLEGRRLPGVPADREGFIPVEPYARVAGAEDVWAAGDGTDHPVKHGGLAAQEADVAALGIAAAAGLPVTLEPLEPVLRGTLLTGDRPWHMRWAAGDGDGLAVQRPLWWPPLKIAGRHLGPYLAGRMEEPPGMRVEVALERPVPAHA